MIGKLQDLQGTLYIFFDDMARVPDKAELGTYNALRSSNRSSDLFEAEVKMQAGDVIYTMMPFIRLHERIHYGKYVANTAMAGFVASDAAVMVVHSADDNVVPIEYGLDLFYDEYKDDPRFEFVRLEDKGHNYIFDDMTYIDEFNAGFDQWL